METNDLIQENENTQTKMELSQESVYYFNQIRKWTTFFSILGFVMVAFLIVFSLFAGAVFSSLGQPYFGLSAIVLGIVYFIIAVLYFFPVLYLYKFSRSADKAIKTNDSDEIAEAFKNLKSHYKFVGIMTIVFLCIYIIFGLFFLIFRLAM